MLKHPATGSDIKKYERRIAAINRKLAQLRRNADQVDASRQVLEARRTLAQLQASISSRDTRCQRKILDTQRKAMRLQRQICYRLKQAQGSVHPAIKVKDCTMGSATVLSIWPSTLKPLRQQIEDRVSLDDDDSLRVDWQIVGNDLRFGMKKLASELKDRENAK